MVSLVFVSVRIPCLQEKENKIQSGLKISTNIAIRHIKISSSGTAFQRNQFLSIYFLSRVQHFGFVTDSTQGHYTVSQSNMATPAGLFSHWLPLFHINKTFLKSITIIPRPYAGGPLIQLITSKNIT